MPVYVRFYLLFLLLSLSACATFRPDKAVKVATGTVAHDLCSETFVSRLDPHLIYQQSILPRPGFAWVAWGIHYEVDRENQQVSSDFVGAARNLAYYTPGLGCTLEPQSQGALPRKKTMSASVGASATPQPNSSSDPKAPSAYFLPDQSLPSPPVRSDIAKIDKAVEEAFAEPSQPPYRQTRAVLVVHQDRLIAERYAPGYGPDTPLLGFSFSKSVTNALLGILVRAGRLQVQAPAPIAAWQAPGDPRGKITVEQLMRMSSGLDLDETGSGFDPSNHMFYTEEDMAGYAERARLIAEPGTRWAYSSGSSHLLARLLRDKTADLPGGVYGFAHQELLTPVGMNTLIMESDTTGTPVGAHYMLASARDWARFGLLYLHDGMVGEKRILPEGWVEFSRTPTPGLGKPYGAMWWTNRPPSLPDESSTFSPNMRLFPRLPEDAFFAFGNLGQRIAVIPSRQLVVVRLAHNQLPAGDNTGFADLVAQIISALPVSSHNN